MKFNIPLPKTGTKAAEDFFKSWRDINRLLGFILTLVTSVDKVSDAAFLAMKVVRLDEAERAEIEERQKKRITAADGLKVNQQLLLESILVRHVENFLNYLSSVLFEIFISRPDVLKSSEQVEVRRVLEHDSIESLVREIAEAKVNALSYSSFSKLADFFEDRFHIRIVDEADMALIFEYIEIRNISVHNRCYISKQFIKRMNLPLTEIGKKKELHMKDLEALIPKLAEVVKFMDVNVRKRMKVKGGRFNV